MSQKVSYQELEQQLSHTKKQNGLLASNEDMIMKSIDALNLLNGHHVLEIDHGNCQHLDLILKKANNINYFGVETSKTMQLEARNTNKNLIKNNPIVFLHYDGNHLPFQPESFDRILTINTIYFWANPIGFLNELSRALKPDGSLVIAFAKKTFMQKLPYINDKFKLYSLLDFKKILNKTNLSLSDSFSFNEISESNNSSDVDPEFFITIIKKESANIVTASLANF